MVGTPINRVYLYTNVYDFNVTMVQPENMNFMSKTVFVILGFMIFGFA